MTLTEEVKDKIFEEYKNWESLQYGKYKDDKKFRKQMGMYYTPPKLTIQMIEQFNDLEGKILDPTCGCGGLLAGCIIAGANPKLCYGIELDNNILEICRERLSKLGVPYYNIHLGDALNTDCYNNFTDSYKYNKDTNSVEGYIFGGIYEPSSLM